jgi:hypothetical protein
MIKDGKYIDSRKIEKVKPVKAKPQATKSKEEDGDK